jgi:shikimate dehydrogenase
MREFGIIGYPLRYSYSPIWFNAEFRRKRMDDAVYRIFPLASLSDLDDLIIQHPDLLGLNVTMPYKKEIIPYLKQSASVATAVKAVNTLKIVRLDKGYCILGFNTDVAGFEHSLTNDWKVETETALVFGTGGAAQAVGFCLGRLGIPYSFVSRHANENCLTYDDLTPEIIARHHLLINATPVGSSSFEMNILPLPFEVIGEQHFLFDLNYNPEMTPFLDEGRKRGAKIKNGMEMLQVQAEESWKIWDLP